MSRNKCKCVESAEQPSTRCVGTADKERAPGLRADVPARANLRDFMAITKALADEQRVRVLMALQRGELCVCQIVELLGLATSTVSKHMSILKQARLVESRKDGRWMYYRLAGDDAPEAVRQATAWAAGLLAGDPQVLRDRQRLAVICTSDPHELCVAQGSGKRACP
ncbi:MAG: ArsR/SmtB family transcription factor [Pirellulaceae bacterium]